MAPCSFNEPNNTNSRLKKRSRAHIASQPWESQDPILTFGEGVKLRTNHGKWQQKNNDSWHLLRVYYVLGFLLSTVSVLAYLTPAIIPWIQYNLRLTREETEIIQFVLQMKSREVKQDLPIVKRPNVLERENPENIFWPQSSAPNPCERVAWIHFTRFLGFRKDIKPFQGGKVFHPF